MRNLTTLAVDAFAHSEGWHAVAPDTEARDAVYAARALRSADTSLVRLTLARLTHTTHEELASLAVVAAPPTLGVAHELVLFQLLSDGGEAAGNAPALCVITAGGDIVLVPLDAPRAEIVGSVEQGVLAAQWSPDEDVLVLVTAPGPTAPAQLLLMTRDFDILHEAPLATDEFGEDAPVNVGWGSKATQFHGSEGKQAAAAAAQAPPSDPRGPLVVDDDLLPRVGWRADGAYFVVSAVEHDASGAHRVLRTYTRAGTLSATSDPTVRGVSQCLAVRPVGNLIATTQRAGRAPDGREWAPGREGRHDVVFFERNGLRHGEFSLREEHGAAPRGDVGTLPEWRTPHTVQSLAWNADGSVLAVHLMRNARTHVVQLWTTRNYHWYLKQELVHADLVGVRWHPEEPLWLYTVRAGGVERRVYTVATHVSHGAPPHDAACVAVVDGSALLLTPFRRQNVPPPMCAQCVVDAPAFDAPNDTPATPVHLAWDTVADGAATCDYLAVLYAGAVHVWRLAYGALGQRGPWTTERVATLRSPPDALQVALAVRGGDAYDVAFVCADAVHLDGRTERVPRGVRVVQTARPSKAFVVAHPDGRVAVGAEAVALPAFCAHLDVFAHGGREVVLGLTSDGRLMLPGRTLAKDATSFAVTHRLVVWTTWTHEARFLPLAALAGDAETLELGRRVERGSTIVAAVPSAMSLVLQMPRGNLETICPRPMVLDVVRDLLDRRTYGDALRISRAHRVDLNLLHDHAPRAFLADVPTLLAQVDQVDHLNLLLDEDVTQSLYRPMLVTPREAWDVHGKVNRVCDAFLDALRVDERRYLTTILTAHVRKTPPDYEGGLRVLLRYQATDPELADEACKYIIFLANAEQLFRVALGMYDFSLALLLAQHSQKDPREYVAFLRELRAKTPEAYQRFCVDDHLGRHTKALHSLVRVDGRTDEALAYMVEHKLYREALDAYAHDAARQRQVYARFAEYLAAHQRVGEAASAYLLAHEPRKAVDAFREADRWEEALGTACQQRLPPAELRALAQALVEQLSACEQYESAARVCLDHLGDVEQGVALLCSAHALPEAVRQSALHGRSDLIETHLAQQTRRLAELDAKRDEAPAQYYPDDAPGLEHIDMQSDTLSQLTQFTRYTAAPSVAESMSTLSLGTRATSRSKAKQKKEQKKKLTGKKGSIYEESYLLDSVQKLLTTRLGALQRSVGALLPTLLTLSTAHRHAARTLQARVLALEAHAHAAADSLGARATAHAERKQQREHELVAAALAALYASRHATRIPAATRPEVAAERWKLHLLDAPQAP
ncbi:ELP1 [Malassezia furfur]|nr:ELP1 [Malassezia furfur]